MTVFAREGLWFAGSLVVSVALTPMFATATDPADIVMIGVAFSPLVYLEIGVVRIAIWGVRTGRSTTLIP